MRASLAISSRLRLLSAQANGHDSPRARIAEGDDDPADVREALLPGRVLDNDRYEIPPVLERREPHLVGRQRQEVGEHEHERARRHRTRVRGQVLERALEPVVGPPVLGRPEALVADLDHLPLALRLAPVRVAVRVVQVPDEAAGGAGARENQLHDVPHRLWLVEPGQRRERSTTSAGAGRRRSRPSAPPRRSAPARRTRHSPRASRAVPTRPSRSSPCRRRGDTAANRRRPCRSRGAGSSSSRRTGR